MSRVGWCLVLSLALGGCATSGRDWVDSPVEAQQASIASVDGAIDPPPDARPRLNHTVTLGETYATYPIFYRPVAPGVQVNVTTPVVVNNYAGGYGYGYGYGYTVPYTRGAAVVTTVPHAVQATQRVGADFPAPPDYGPRALR